MLNPICVHRRSSVVKNVIDFQMRIGQFLPFVIVSDVETVNRCIERSLKMTYNAEINRQNPSMFVFLVDQSGSMQDFFGSSETPRQKADVVADSINRLLQNLTIRCAKPDVRDYYFISVIGYGNKVGPALGGILSGRDIVSISEIANNPIRIEEKTKKIDDGAGGIVDQKIKMPIWFDSIANGGTPMCEAMRLSQTILSTWIAQHPTAFPPIVINITDGESTDGDPSVMADGIKGISSNDGNVLLFNIHISSVQGVNKVEFPDSEITLPPDQYASLLFRISSVLPEYMRNIAKQEEFSISEASKGFIFNGDPVALVRFLDIGTRAANLR